MRFEKKHFFLFLTFITLLRLVTAPHFSLGVDEAHYVLYGLHPDLSYFDHPPLVGWVQYIIGKLFGFNELSARVVAIVAGALTTYFLFRFIYRLTDDEHTATISAAALNVSFIFDALFLMLLPETLLFVLFFPLLEVTYNTLHRSRLTDYALLGFLLGLSGLAKYTAILLIFPIFIYIIVKKAYSKLFNLKTLLTISIALCMILPVIAWNMQHDWISFTYQSEHVAGEQQIHLKSFFVSFAAQFGAYSPFLMPLAFYGLYKGLKDKRDLAFLAALFGLIIELFFAYSSLYKRALPHWNALFYLATLPLGVMYFYQKHQKYIHFAISISFVVVLILHMELIFKFIPTPKYKSLHRDIYGFDTILEHANSHIKNSNTAIAVTNWTLGSRALFYNQPYHSDVYVIDKRFDQFDLWQKGSPKGKNILFINTHFFHKEIARYAKCDKVENLESFDIKLNGVAINHVDIVACYNFQGLR